MRWKIRRACCWICNHHCLKRNGAEEAGMRFDSPSSALFHYSLSAAMPARSAPRAMPAMRKHVNNLRNNHEQEF
jgi:hypothetical protein